MGGRRKPLTSEHFQLAEPPWGILRLFVCDWGDGSGHGAQEIQTRLPCLDPAGPCHHLPPTAT